MQKSADAFRTISEVADDLSLPQHVLRFWETRFPQIRPLKRAGGRRYYRPVDVSLLKAIQQLLYDEGYTIKGVQRLLKEQGAKGLSAGLPPTALDWDPTSEDENEDVAGTAVEPSPDTESGGPPHHPPSPFVAGHRGAIAEALSSVDECKRILDALFVSPR